MFLRNALTVLITTFIVTTGFAQTQAPTQLATGQPAKSADVQKAFQEAQKTLGTVPAMFKLIPEAAVPGAWAEFRDLELSQKTALPNKYKELIGVAVAAQIPCQYCAYFHKQSLLELNKGTQNEHKEALAIAALARQWSTFLNGLNQDEKVFTREVDRMMRSFQPSRQTQARSSDGSVSGATTESMTFTTPLKTADEVYKAAQKMWGFVPQFIKKYPSEGVAGAWNQHGAVFMNPNAEIPDKYKSLISLAVSAQVPCQYCVIMDTKGAKSMGASEREINEALAIASLTRYWSTVLNGSMVNLADFQRETDQIIAFAKRPIAETTQPATEETISGTTAEEGTTSGATTESSSEESTEKTSDETTSDPE